MADVNTAQNAGFRQILLAVAYQHFAKYNLSETETQAGANRLAGLANDHLWEIFTGDSHGLASAIRGLEVRKSLLTQLLKEVVRKEQTGDVAAMGEIYKIANLAAAQYQVDQKRSQERKDILDGVMGASSPKDRATMGAFEALAMKTLKSSRVDFAPGLDDKKKDEYRHFLVGQLEREIFKQSKGNRKEFLARVGCFVKDDQYKQSLGKFVGGFLGQNQKTMREATKTARHLATPQFRKFEANKLLAILAGPLGIVYLLSHHLGSRLRPKQYKARMNLIMKPEERPGSSRARTIEEELAAALAELRGAVGLGPPTTGYSPPPPSRTTNPSGPSGPVPGGGWIPPTPRPTPPPPSSPGSPMPGTMPGQARSSSGVNFPGPVIDAKSRVIS